MTDTEVRIMERLAIIESKLTSLSENALDRELRIRRLEAGSGFLHAISAGAGAVLYYLFQLMTGKGGN